MCPAELTKASIIKWGGDAVYQQGEALARKGAVLKAELNDRWITGVIAREDGHHLPTRLRLVAPGRIESHCPCYTHQRSGQVCAHVVALGISLMMRLSDPLREQKYREDQRRGQRLERHLREGAFLRRNPRGTPARIRLALNASWVDEFRTGNVVLAIQFVINGTGALPEHIPPHQTLALSPEDETLLANLEDINVDPLTSRITLTPPDFFNVLDTATHTKIDVEGDDGMVILQEDLPIHLQVNLDHRTGELIVAPHPLLPDPAATPSMPPIFLVWHRTGRVLCGNRLYRMRNILPGPYQGLYRAAEIVPRNRVLSFLKTDLPALEKWGVPITMELTADLFETVPGRPLFRLELAGSRASLRATLRAVYGEHTLIAGLPSSHGELSIPDPDDLLKYQTRNLDAECKALKMLARYGFESDPDAPDGSQVLIGPRETLNFLGTGYPSLGRFGWKIVFSQRLLELVESIPVITPVVQIAEKRGGWFEVGYTFERPDGTIPSTEIQRAINRGDAWLESHGTTYLLDREAVESMRGVFSDCQTRPGEKPGHFQLSPVYAPFVQASLKALDGFDIEDPPDWRDKASTCNRSANTRLEPVPLGTLENTLRPYQKEGVYWLRFIEKSGLNGLLADEMGLGKTLQTLAWLSLPRTDARAQGKPALIVCPTSLVENWHREAQTFVPHVKCLVIAGTNRAECFKRISEHDLVITSYALLRRDLEAYHPIQFSVAVLDEAQHIKNRTTQNAVAAKQINAVGKLVLTGTPIENSVADLWSIMDYLMPDYLGAYETFREGYELPIAAGDREGDLAQLKLRRKLNPFLLRRLKIDVAKDLPEKIVKTSFCTLTSDQLKVYEALLSQSRQTMDGLVKSKGFDRSRFEILAMLMRLRQTCCHLDLLKDHHPPGTYTAPSAKLDAFMELLDEAMDGGHRILVFSQFVTLLKLLRTEFDMRGIPYCYLDGSTQDRLAQCQRFNLTPTIPVFFISLKAGGTGLNLTGADMVVHFDPWWNPAVEDQATDRAHRIGQKRTVYSIKLIAEHTIEENVLALQKKKQAIIRATVGTTDESVMQKLTFDDIKDLIGL